MRVLHSIHQQELKRKAKTKKKQKHIKINDVKNIARRVIRIPTTTSVNTFSIHTNTGISQKTTLQTISSATSFDIPITVNQDHSKYRTNSFPKPNSPLPPMDNTTRGTGKHTVTIHTKGRNTFSTQHEDIESHCPGLETKCMRVSSNEHPVFNNKTQEEAFTHVNVPTPQDIINTPNVENTNLKKVAHSREEGRVTLESTTRKDGEISVPKTMYTKNKPFIEMKPNFRKSVFQTGVDEFMSDLKVIKCIQKQGQTSGSIQKRRRMTLELCLHYAGQKQYQNYLKDNITKITIRRKKVPATESKGAMGATPSKEQRHKDVQRVHKLGTFKFGNNKLSTCGFLKWIISNIEILDVFSCIANLVFTVFILRALYSFTRKEADYVYYKVVSTPLQFITIVIIYANSWLPCVTATTRVLILHDVRFAKTHFLICCFLGCILHGVMHALQQTLVNVITVSLFIETLMFLFYVYLLVRVIITFRFSWNVQSTILTSSSTAQLFRSRLIWNIWIFLMIIIVCVTRVICLFFCNCAWRGQVSMCHLPESCLLDFVLYSIGCVFTLVQTRPK